MIGERIGTYSIVRKIGEGGMGTVWLAEHTVIGKRVAIKMLHASFSGQIDLTTRFFNEARAAAAIQDPGIVQVFDFGQHVDGRAYIVMEVLEGEALDQRLARLGRLSLPEALRIMQQVAGSLGAAHRGGIVHRDLKPDNIFLIRDAAVPGGERAKILDFGIAKISGGVGMKTATSVVMGTPLFMSPEQCRGAGQVDQRSDVYSLGCLLFMLLTGRPPFVGEGPGEILAMHLREVPPAPSELAAGVPHSVDSLVLRCLEKDAARRPASAEDVAAALGEVHATTTGAIPVQAAEPLPEVRRLSATHATTLQPYSQVSQPSRAQRSKHHAGILAAGGGTILGVVVMVLAMPGGKAPGGEAPAAREETSTSATREPSAPTPPPVPAPAAAGTTAPDVIEIEELPAAPPAAPPPPPAAEEPPAAEKPPTLQMPAAAEKPPAPKLSVVPPAPRPSVVPPARAAAAKKELPDVDKLGTTPAPDCAAQAAKLEELIRSSPSLTPDVVVRTTRSLATSCFNNQQLTRLLMIAIPAACTLNQESAVLRFYALAPSAPLRNQCKKYLAR